MLFTEKMEINIVRVIFMRSYTGIYKTDILLKLKTMLKLVQSKKNTVKSIGICSPYHPYHITCNSLDFKCYRCIKYNVYFCICVKVHNDMKRCPQEYMTVCQELEQILTKPHVMVSLSIIMMVNQFGHLVK